MAGYDSGELFWDTAEATARRWVLLLDGPPGVARRRLDPQDPSTPQAASASQLRELIRRTFHEDTGHWPVSVTLAVVRYKQLSLSRFLSGMMRLSHHHTVAGGTTHGRCTVHRAAVPSDGVPGFHERDS